MKSSDIIIYDTTTASELGDLLREKPHYHTPQDTLEKIFGTFSNALHLYRKTGDYSYTIEKIDTRK